MYVFGNTDICLWQNLETIKEEKYMGYCDSQWAGKTQEARERDAVTPNGQAKPKKPESGML